MLPFRTLIVVFALVSGVLTSFSVFAYESVFDRLDGTGPSKKRVDVVEWDNNLEIHVYPKGTNVGIGVKLDERESGKKVMVIGYTFNGREQIVRRAILGIPFTNKLKGFIDPSEKDFEKIAISNHDLQKPWIPYKLQPAPKQWGPDGSKYDEDSTEEQLTEMKKNDAMDYHRFNHSEGQGRMPASEKKGKYVHPAQRMENENAERTSKPSPQKHDDGGVQEYQW